MRPAVEVLGPWLHNKGDDMMLRAMGERLMGTYALAASSQLGMPAMPNRPPLHRVQWRPSAGALAQAVRGGALGYGLALLRKGAKLTLVPRTALRARRVVDGRELVALLDCSGFAYGDQWSPHRLRKRAAYYNTLRQRGTRLVLLPQALGPFHEEPMRSHARALFEPFDLVFARDEASKAHVESLGVRARAVPDITHLLEGVPPADPAAWARRVCVVPNARMLDKTTREVAARYLDYVAGCVRRVLAASFEPCLVLHETNDDTLVAEVAGRVDAEVPVYDEDALVTKGYLGACYANLGSRYHSLVSSLSQGTPSVGTSWAHKYDALFEEYGCEKWLLSPDADAAEIDQRLSAFLEPRRRDALAERLRRAAQAQKQKVEAMWQEVEALLAHAA